MGEIVTVNFRGDQLYGFKGDDGTFLALKPMVEAMGLDWSAQFRRVQRDPILHEAIAMMATPFGHNGGQECVCIKLELVNGWLFTIDSARIKGETVRERVILYQRECYQVLHDHFAGKRRPVAEVEGDPTEQPTTSERLRLVTEARQSFSSQAAREMWFKQGLPIVPSMVNPQQNDLFHFGMVNHGGSEQAA